MLLPGNQNGRILSAFAEQVLIEVSGAFGHSFSLMHEKIGEESEKAYGERLTQETVDAIEACGGALLFSGDEKDENALYDALALPLRIRSYCVPQSLCARHETSAALWIAVSLSSDAETLENAMRSAFLFAQASDASILSIPPNGASKALWDDILKNTEKEFPDLPVSSMRPSDAVRSLILTPDQMGILLCPPYAGGILSAAADALCVYPLIQHDTAMNGNLGIYSVSSLQNDQNAEEAFSPIASVYAVIDLLRFSLRLDQEAACVEAALNNVLMSASDRQDDQIEAEQMTDLICEQISVAGELMHKGGLGN